MSRKRKILLIDDDQILTKLIVRRLTNNGFEVDSANTAKEGLHKIMSETYDLVLLDIKMPDQDGLEVLKLIREQHPKNHLPVIMISSCEGHKEVIGALELGANDYVTKPIEFDVLDARIATHTELRELSSDFAQSKEQEAIAAMIVTYHHEINNPLAIAMGFINKMKKTHPEALESLEKVDQSLHRVKDIVAKIEKVSREEAISFEPYLGKTKMVKI